MKNFLSTFILCLFLAGIGLYVICAFVQNTFALIAVIALALAFFISAWMEHDERLKALEKRIQDLENSKTHIGEKENEQ